MGPGTVAVDRFNDSDAIADSWQQQTLLNIVKLRYMDLPVFVDVSSIVSGYSLQTGVNIAGTASTQAAVQGNFLAAGAQAVYTYRPTITFVPLTGEEVSARHDHTDRPEEHLLHAAIRIPRRLRAGPDGRILEWRAQPVRGTERARRIRSSYARCN